MAEVCVATVFNPLKKVIDDTLSHMPADITDIISSRAVEDAKIETVRLMSGSDRKRYCKFGYFSSTWEFVIVSNDMYEFSVCQDDCKSCGLFIRKYMSSSEFVNWIYSSDLDETLLDENIYEINPYLARDCFGLIELIANDIILDFRDTACKLMTGDMINRA